MVQYFEKVVNFYHLKKQRVYHDRGLIIHGVPLIINLGEIRIGKSVRLNSKIEANPVGFSGKIILVTREHSNLEIGNRVGISNSVIVCWE